jgi:hypothetical protein
MEVHRGPINATRPCSTMASVVRAGFLDLGVELVVAVEVDVEVRFTCIVRTFQHTRGSRWKCAAVCSFSIRARVHVRSRSTRARGAYSVGVICYPCPSSSYSTQSTDVQVHVCVRTVHMYVPAGTIVLYTYTYHGPYTCTVRMYVRTYVRTRTIMLCHNVHRVPYMVHISPNTTRIRTIQHRWQLQ